MRMIMGFVLLAVAIVIALTGLQSSPGISVAHAAGQITCTVLLTLICGGVGLKMMRRPAPSEAGPATGAS